MGHLAQPVHREGLASHVQDETAHLVERVVAGGAAGDGAVARGLECLKDGAGGPVGTGLGAGGGHDLVGDLHEIALILETQGLVGSESENNVARPSGGGVSPLDG